MAFSHIYITRDKLWCPVQFFLPQGCNQAKIPKDDRNFLPDIGTLDFLEKKEKKCLRKRVPNDSEGLSFAAFVN